MTLGRSLDHTDDAELVGSALIGIAIDILGILVGLLELLECLLIIAKLIVEPTAGVEGLDGVGVLLTKLLVEHLEDA